ncbi:MAG: hypothetical protein H0V12_03520 [Chloroflexi bacterium]|nr:hypothetical protein [Chloroflexota bacterium]
MTTRENDVGPDLFLISHNPSPPLRIGLLVDSLRLPLWKRSIVELLEAANYTEVTLVLHADGPAWAGDRSWRTLLFRQYERMDRWLYGSRRVPEPDRLVDCRELLGAVPRAALRVGHSAAPHRRELAEADADLLHGLDLDVIIDLGSGELDGSIVAASANGVWQCHFGPGPDGGERHAGFPELAGHAPLTTVSLRRDVGCHAPSETLATATTSTVAGVSWALNRFEPLWLGTELIVQMLHRLHQHGPESLEPVPVPESCTTRASSPQATSNAATVGFLIAALARKARRRLQHPSPDLVNEWRLAIRPIPEQADGIPVLHDASGFVWLESPPGRHWADPFILEREGETWLFFEEYLHDEGRGVISAAPVNGDGRPGPARRVLDTGGHLSYPFLFEDGDDVYLLPESADRRSTTLYRATDFPHHWERAVDLGVGLQLLDTTILHENGLYWIFTTVPGRHRSGYTVLLFWAESLEGSWHPHPASPICRDIRYARGAGSIIRSDGRLFRPVQDGAGGYGRRIHFFEIRELTMGTFREEYCGTLDPTALPDAPSRLEGVHTYNRSGHFEVIDGVRLERRPGYRDRT